MKNVENTPNDYARIGGILYLMIIVAGFFAVFFVRGQLIVHGDAATTVNNIASSSFLWRIGITADLIMHICDIPVILIFYLLLRPVNKNLALVAVFLNLIQTAVLVANKMNLIDVLLLVVRNDYLNALEPQQLYAWVELILQSHDHGFGVGLIFFGFECLVLGYLILKSGYLPKTLGILMQIAGFCYLTNSFSLLLAPGFAQMIFPAIMGPVLIAELSFCFWLIFKGVNINQWQRRVGLT